MSVSALTIMRALLGLFDLLEYVTSPIGIRLSIAMSAYWMMMHIPPHGAMASFSIGVIIYLAVPTDD